MVVKLRAKAVFYRAHNCTSNPETSQILWPGHFTFYSVVYGFNGRLLPAFKAAMADFNSGNMLLTIKLNIFTTGMTPLLNHLNHPVKPRPC